MADKWDKKANRQKAKSRGNAMSDGSFPIESSKDLKDAIGLAGNAKDPAKARRHIIRMARKMGLSNRIPDHWNADGSVDNK